VTATVAPAANDPLAERFANPPAETRILKIIHGWPDDPGQQDALRARLQQQGFGGVVCNVSFQGYLEDESRWQAFQRAVRTARAEGMTLWLYDERGYPSGNAGGQVLSGHPEWEARGMLVADIEAAGGPCTLRLPPGRRILCAAYPVSEGRLILDRRIDLSDAVQGDTVSWQAPEGRWRLLAVSEHRLYEGTHADQNLWEKLPYVNLLEAGPTARFLELTHAAYARRLGRDLGRFFQATFTDEPSLMSMYFQRQPFRPLPWSPQLPEAFRRRRGYDLEPILPSLVADTGPETARHRHDFWMTVGELVSENYFGQIQDWCRGHGVPSGGHLLAEEGLTSHVALYGDFFRCLRRFDAPGIDCLTSVPAEVPGHIARLAASAAELEGRSLVMCETSDHGQVYRLPGDQRPKRIVTEEEIRGTCNRLFVHGVNLITSYYSFTGLSDDALRRLNEWVGRGGALLRGGHQVADVAVVYPAESLWTQFVPGRHWANESPGANRIDTLFRGVLSDLAEARREHTVIDSRTLGEARVKDGALVLGAHRWRAVVLPGVDTLPRAAWRKLDRFVETGGILIAIGNRPANNEREFPSAEVRRLGRRWFGAGAWETAGPGEASSRATRYLPPGSEALLPAVLDGFLEPDVLVSPPRAPLRSTHRRIEGHDVYFVVNDSPRPWEGAVTLRGVGDGERFDFGTGGVTPIRSGGSHEISLEAYGAAAFRFDAVRPPGRKAVASGTLPGMVARALPDASPRVARGEFVREQFDRVDQEGVEGRDVWRAQATLARGQVDTFLFVCFSYADSVDLSEATAIEVESWVPEGQRTATQLLVIVHEKGGGDFIATTARGLNAPGYERSFIPLNRLQLAGWLEDADGMLDLSRVEEIRVGWGGYLGEEGEQVVFRVTAPRAVKAP